MELEVEHDAWDTVQRAIELSNRMAFRCEAKRNFHAMHATAY